ncbi:MAG: hypothetical protein K8R59_06295 [Thermoanaerobaculales bacterium]|nr:hypothetical protein [Thermoanaerobaculales bacterium]
MITSLFRSFRLHLKARAQACFRSPSAWVALVSFGLIGVLYWPSATVNPLEETREGLPILLVWLLWFWLWPMPPMVYARGRTTEKSGNALLGVGGVPTLPVGPRTRALAEAAFTLVVLGIIRHVAISIYQGQWSWRASAETLAGGFFLLPVFLAWALPNRNPATFMLRPLAVAVLAAGVHVAGGFFDTWWGIVGAGLLLSALVLSTAGLEVPEWRTKGAPQPKSRRRREAIRPTRQLSRDAWLPLLKSWGPWVFLAVIAYALCMILDVHGSSWKWIFFAGFEVFLVIILQPLLRPFNSNLVAESLVGKHEVSRGDFLRAWSVLPVSPAAVLRRVWLHGAVVGLVLWTVPVAMLIIRHRLLEGLWSVTGGIGNLMQFVVVGAFFVPMMAGLLVAVALGRRLEIALSGFSLLLGIHALFFVRILLQELFGRGTPAAVGGTLLVLIILVAVGSLPPLLFLGGVRKVEPA